MTHDGKQLYDLEFQVEVSTRYHEWRRSDFESLSMVFRASALGGSILALVFLLASPGEDLKLWVALASGFAAVVTLIDLVYRVDYKARLHTDLYQRFKKLQADIARGREAWDSRIHDWEAEAQTIRIDEPPTMWAIYVTSWNQSVARRNLQTDLRRIQWWQAILGRFVMFRPKDFPVEAGI